MHMRDQLERRLAELRSEYETGQKAVADLESKLNALKATLDRIRGAIEVIEELLAEKTNHASQ
jgi:predicted  nucleic acid-binding Zn-ribbon protein